MRDDGVMLGNWVAVFYCVLCIHIIPFAVFFFVFRRRWWCLLFHQVFSIQRTCSVEFQPWGYALEIEHVDLIAR